MNRKIILLLFLSLSLNGFMQLPKPISPKLAQMQKEFNGIWYLAGYCEVGYFNKVKIIVISETQIEINVIKTKDGDGGQIKVLSFNGKKLKLKIINSNSDDWNNAITTLFYESGVFDDNSDCPLQMTRKYPYSDN